MKQALIVAVTDATCALAKRKPEKIGLVRDSNPRVYNDPTQWPAPSWLVSLPGGALPRHRRGQGFKSRTSLNFIRLFFTTAKVASITAVVFPVLKISRFCRLCKRGIHKVFSRHTLILRRKVYPTLTQILTGYRFIRIFVTCKGSSHLWVPASGSRISHKTRCSRRRLRLCGLVPWD